MEEKMKTIEIEDEAMDRLLNEEDYERVIYRYVDTIYGGYNDEYGYNINYIIFEDYNNNFFRLTQHVSDSNVHYPDDNTCFIVEKKQVTRTEYVLIED